MVKRPERKWYKMPRPNGVNPMVGMNKTISNSSIL